MRAVIVEMLPHWRKERKASGTDQWDEVWEGVLHMCPAPIRRHQNFKHDLHSYIRLRRAKFLSNRVNQQVNLTTPKDEANWIDNYRIPDSVLLTPPRFQIDKETYMVGAPDVVVEIRSPGDESYKKSSNSTRNSACPRHGSSIETPIIRKSICFKQTALTRLSRPIPMAGGAAPRPESR